VYRFQLSGYITEMSNLLKMSARLLLLAILIITSYQPAGAEVLLDKPYRGISLLQCYASRTQCRNLCNLLYKAELKNNIVAIIADGTFGYNLASLAYCADVLTLDQRNLKVLMYAHSGPAARVPRDYRGQPGWAAGVPARSINWRIQHDKAFQDSYRAHVRERIRPAVMYLLAKGAQPLVGWLEDNFSEDAFVWFYVLTAEELGGLPVEYVRNHVHGHQFTPVGVTDEVHTIDPDEGIENGITFNDGFEVQINPCMKVKDSQTSMADLEEVQFNMGLQGNAHINWFGPYQGRGSRHPLKRKFPSPTACEERAIIKLLRSR